MSSIRSNRSNGKEQQKLKKTGIRELRKMAYERILKNPQAYLDKVEELLFDYNRSTAAELIFKLASEAEMDLEQERQQEQEQKQSKQPSIIDKWEVEFEQQQREKQQKAAKEAAEAQRAAAWELGQVPEPDPVPEQPAVDPAFTSAFMQSVRNKIDQQQPAGRHSNTLANEIGLPRYGGPQSIYS